MDAERACEKHELCTLDLGRSYRNGVSREVTYGCAEQSECHSDGEAAAIGPAAMRIRALVEPFDRFRGFRRRARQSGHLGRFGRHGLCEARRDAMSRRRPRPNSEATCGLHQMRMRCIITTRLIFSHQPPAAHHLTSLLSS